MEPTWMDIVPIGIKKIKDGGIQDGRYTWDLMESHGQGDAAGGSHGAMGWGLAELEKHTRWRPPRWPLYSGFESKVVEIRRVATR